MKTISPVPDVAGLDDFLATGYIKHEREPATVRLWGLLWECEFLAGKLMRVQLSTGSVDAREALRDSLCDALERAHAEVTA